MFKGIIVIAMLLMCVQAYAHADYEIIICDGCNYEQKELQVVHRSNTVNGTVIVVDFINRSIVAIGREYYYEPGYSTVNTWFTSVPEEYEFSFNEYLQIEDRINNMFLVEKSWSAIPRQLSINGTVNAVATV